MPNRVIIVEDDRELSQLLALRCRNMGLEVETAADGFDAVCSIFLSGRCERPNLVILDVNLPYRSGLFICEKLLQEGILVPVIVLTGRTDGDTIRQCEELGAHYLRKSQDLWSDLYPLICQLLAMGPQDAIDGEDEPSAPECETSRDSATRAASTVLCIDDDPDFTQAIETRLAQLGINVVPAYSGVQGFWAAVKQRPQLIITDYSMPDGHASYLLRRLKDHTLTRDIPVIVVTGRDIAGRLTQSKDGSLERRLRNQGAECVLSKPLDHQLLMAELRSHVTLSVDGNSEVSLHP